MEGELETRGELDRTQDTQAVFSKSSKIDGPEQATVEITPAIDRVFIALIVKSRRRAASSIVMKGSPTT